MKKLRITLFFFLLLLLSACSSTEQWEGFVYPDRDNLLIHRSAGEFKSLEICEAASMAVLKEMDATQKGYYICGKNCGYDLAACKETIRGNFYK